MVKAKKVGILGGTFNPIHLGHLIIAENAYRQFELDEVLIMPAYIPPHKQNTHILEDSVRMDMVKAAVSKVPYFIPSDFEIRKGNISYTSDTLALLTEENPENAYYLIMGADSLYSIEQWHCPRQIFEKAGLLVAARDDAGSRQVEAQAVYLKHKYNAHIQVMTVPRIEISSTLIRQRICSGQTIKYFVPEAVEQYILEHHLYVKEKNKQVQEDGL